MSKAMEPPKSDSPKLPDMIMCGDHPSVTKTELNTKESRPEKVKMKSPPPHSRITPTSSRTERPQQRAISEMVLRTAEPTPLQRADSLPANKTLVYAALGSFRWPPYLLCVWVLVLVLTHALHAVVAVLETALPPLRKLCVYLRTWTEESWRAEAELNRKAAPLATGACTACAYALYGALYALHALALWAIEPLRADTDERAGAADLADLTTYIEDVGSKTNFALKH
ncbi:uncharacterized protein [Battus philenor]|uniref:uncharacterized protein n=1 Tax=Battus philenor TaxID=42288 RepID=UPI0035D0A89F